MHQGQTEATEDGAQRTPDLKPLFFHMNSSDNVNGTQDPKDP